MFSWFCLENIGCCFGNSSVQNNNLWFQNKTMKTHVTQSLFSKPCDTHDKPVWHPWDSWCDISNSPVIHDVTHLISMRHQCDVNNATHVQRRHWVYTFSTRIIGNAFLVKTTDQKCNNFLRKCVIFMKICIFNNVYIDFQWTVGRRREANQLSLEQPKQLIVSRSTTFLTSSTRTGEYSQSIAKLSWCSGILHTFGNFLKNGTSACDSLQEWKLPSSREWCRDKS